VLLYGAALNADLYRGGRVRQPRSELLQILVSFSLTGGDDSPAAMIAGSRISAVVRDV
jgi:hypothetical protein